MRLLKAADYPTMPWKNGGGETREIALSPPGASMGDFDWRVSIARVDGEGPFSVFDGIDRTLTLLHGAMTLHDADGGATFLDPSSPPFAFDGGRAISALVTSGPVFDLNVMTRRDRHRHSVHREMMCDSATLAGTTPVTLAIALADGLSCARTVFARHDCLMLEPGEAVDLIAGPVDVAILLIEIL